MKTRTKKQLILLASALILSVALLCIFVVGAKYITGINGTEKSVTVESTYKTVLYSDGSFVVNESLADFKTKTNPEEGGLTATATYAPLNSDNTYSFATADAVPWKDQLANIKTATIANTITPADTSYWFYGCNQLTEVDLTKATTSSSLTKMTSMFEGCSLLTAINGMGENFGTVNVTNMNGAFKGCASLAELDLTYYKSGAGLAYATDMFSGCTNLTAIYATENLDMSSFSPAQTMFANCSAKLDGGRGTKWSSEKTGSAYAHLDGGASNPGLFRSIAGNQLWYKVDGTTLRLSHVEKSGYSEASSALDATQSSDVPWLTAAANVTEVVFEGEIVPTSMAFWFNGLSKLSTLTDISNINSAGITSLNHTFAGCESLGVLDLSAFTNENITDMTSTFQGCTYLETIKVDNTKWTDGKELDSNDTFAGCSSYLVGRGADGTQTQWDGNHNNAIYARVQKEDYPGYFTDINVADYAAYWWYDTDNTTLHVSKNKLTAKYKGSDDIVKGFDLTSFNPPWASQLNNIKHIVIDGSADTDKIQMSSAAGLFAMITNCETIVGFDYLDMTQATSACGMFAMLGMSTTNGVDADFSKLITTVSLENTSVMFAMAKVKELDLSGMVTSGVTDMSGMFTSIVLTENHKLDLSGFSNASAEKMGSMFGSEAENPSIEEIDISGFGTTSITDAQDVKGMFSQLTNLERIWAAPDFDLSELTGSEEVFYHCYKLIGTQGTKYSDSYHNNDYARVDLVLSSDKPGYFSDKNAPRLFWGIPETEDGNAGDTLYLSPVKTAEAPTEDEAPLFVTSLQDVMMGKIPWYNKIAYGHSNVTTVEIQHTTSDRIAPMSMSAWFCNLQGTGIRTINGLDDEHIDTSGLLAMFGTFAGDVALPSLDLSGLTTDHVENMSMMFYNAGAYCGTTFSLNLGGDFTTESVTDMSGMFASCKTLQTIDLSKLDTSNVTNMTWLFISCSRLETVILNSGDDSKFTTSNVNSMDGMFAYVGEDLSEGQGTEIVGLDTFDTSKVTIMGRETGSDMDFYGGGMFEGAKLDSIDVSSFDTSKVQNAYSMFANLILTKGQNELDVSNFSSAELTNMSYMFSGLGVSSIEFGQEFTTEKVENAGYAFYANQNLFQLDLSNFHDEKIQDIESMFAFCQELKTIYADPTNWTTTEGHQGSEAFQESPKLVGKGIGGININWSSAHVDGDYAMVPYKDEGGTVHPGYFTDSSLKPHLYYKVDGSTLRLSPVKVDETYKDGIKALNSRSEGDVPWLAEAANVTAVDMTHLTTETKIMPTSMAYWFKGLSDCESIAGLDDTYVDTAGLVNMNSTFSESGFTELDFSNFTVSTVTTMESTFHNCKNLETLDLTGKFNLLAAENMKEMFSGIGTSTTDGTSVTFASTIEAENVKTMEKAFYNAKLKDGIIDLSGFATERLESMKGMFAEQNSDNVRISSIAFGEDFKTGNVLDMSSAFYGFDGSELDLTQFSNSVLEDVSQMFMGSANLVTIYVDSSKWLRSDGYPAQDSTFEGCVNLVGKNTETGHETAHGDTSTYDSGLYAYTDLDDNFRGLFTHKAAATVVPYYGISGTTLYISATQTAEANIPEERILTGFASQEEIPWLSSGQPTIQKVTIQSAKKLRPTGMDYLFSGLTSCEEISGLENISTIDTASMAHLFDGDATINQINLEGFKANSLSTDTAIAGMFNGCVQLERIWADNSFDLSKLGKVEMFTGCVKLNATQGTSFASTKSAVGSIYACIDNAAEEPSRPGYFSDSNAPRLFWGIVEPANTNDVRTLYLSPEKTEQAPYENELPLYATDRAQLPLIPWFSSGATIEAVEAQQAADTKITPRSMAGWCYGFENLETVTGFDNNHIDTSNLTLMYGTFADCKKLETLDMSNFSTPNVQIAMSAFAGCTVLKTLDLSGWSNQSLIVLDEMFLGCTGLQTIYANPKLWTRNARYYSVNNTFQFCFSLVGTSKNGHTTAHGNTPTSIYDSGDYAYIDEDDSKPGMLSYKSDDTLFYKLDGNTLHLAPISMGTGYINAPNALNPDPASLETDLPWLAQKDTIEYVVIDHPDSGKRITPQSMCGWFYQLSKCVEITGLDDTHFDTSVLTSLQDTFNGCGVHDLDLSDFSTQTVVSMMGTFANTADLESIDLSGSFKTRNVTNMSQMFKLTGIASLDLSNFNTKLANNMSGMFAGFKGTLLHLNTFDNKSLTNVEDMFSGCFNLERVFVDDKTWTSEKASTFTATGTFSGCSKLIGVSKDGLHQTAHGTSPTVYDAGIYARVDVDSDVEGLFTYEEPPLPEEYAYWGLSEDGKTLYLCATATEEAPTIDGGIVSGYDSYEETPWADEREGITTVVIQEGADGAKIESNAMDYLFAGLTNCTAIQGFENINTLNTTSMKYAFLNDTGLVELDLTAFSSPSVVNAEGMFNGCSALKRIWTTSSFNLSFLSGTQTIFDGCTSLEGSHGTKYDSRDPVTDNSYGRIDNAGYDDMPGYFSDKDAPTLYWGIPQTKEGNAGDTLYISPVATAEATIESVSPMYVMGQEDIAAGKIPWYPYIESGTSVTKVEFQNPQGQKIKTQSLAGWFCNISDKGAGVQQITGLDDNHIDTSDLFTMMGTFAGDAFLMNVDLSGLTTNNVENMSLMFYNFGVASPMFGTSPTINLSGNFSTESVTTMQSMFAECKTLQSIDLSMLDTSNVINMSAMFDTCEKMNTITLYRDEDSKFTTSSVLDMSGMFMNVGGKNNAGATIVGLDRFDTRNVQTMGEPHDSSRFYGGGMFEGANLTSIDLSSFNTSSVESMYQMFKSFILTSEEQVLDISSFSTEKLANMNSTFCNFGPTSIEFGDGFTAENVTDFYYCFDRFKGENLDLRSFVTSRKLKVADFMFHATNLKSIYATENFDLSQTQASFSDTVFYESDALFGYMGTTNVGSSHASGIYGRVDKGPRSEQSGLFSEPYSRELWYKVENDGSEQILHIAPQKLDDDYADAKTALDSEDQYDIPWTSYASTITQVSLEGGTEAETNLIRPSSMSYWFIDFVSLREVNGWENVVSAMVTSLRSTFNSCSALEKLDLSEFDNFSMMNMESAFGDCSILESIKADPEIWTNQGMIEGEYTFDGCYSLYGTGRENTTSIHGYAGIGIEYNSAGFAQVNSFENTAGLFTDKDAPDIQAYWGLHDGTLYFSKTKVINKTEYGNNSIVKGINDKLGRYWTEYKGLIENVNILGNDTSTDQIALETADRLFDGLENAKSLIGLKFLDLTNATSANEMFKGFGMYVTGGAEIDSEDLITTGSLTKTEAMFQGVKLNSGLSLPKMDTSNVSSMKNMFAFSSINGSIDLSELSNASAETMDSMFQESSAEEIDISGFTKTSASFEYMFNSCYSLNRIWANEQFDLSGGFGQLMFQGCNALKATQGTKYNSSYTFSNYAHIDHAAEDPSDPGYFSDKSAPRFFWGLTTESNNGEAGTLYLSAVKTENANMEDEMPLYYEGKEELLYPDEYIPWLVYSSSIKKVVVEEDSSYKIFPESMRSWFVGLNNCTSFEGFTDDAFDLSRLKDMTSTFDGCYNLGSLDLSGLSSDTVKKMDKTFYGCQSITSLKLPKFDSGSLESMNNTFGYLGRNNTNVDVSMEGIDNLKTGSVKDMTECFSGAKINNIDFSNFDTSSVTTMEKMFYDSRVVTGEDCLDISSFKTDALISCEEMFENYGRGCQIYPSIKFGEGFTVENAETMDHMFYNYGGSVLDLSTFSPSSSVSIFAMFANCGNLEAIFVDKTKWQYSYPTQTQVFDGCTHPLKATNEDGSKVTWDSTKTSGQFAHPTSLANPGLLTDIDAPVNNAYWMYDDNSKALHISRIPLTEAYEADDSIIEGFSLQSFNPPWNDHLNDIQSVVIDGAYGSGTQIPMVSTKGLFANLPNCTSITGLGNLDLTNVTDATAMFYFLGANTANGAKCSFEELTQQNHKIVNLSRMFEGAKVEEINLSGLEIQNPEDMSAMFKRVNLTKNGILDLKHFVVINRANITEMFGSNDDITNNTIKQIDISGFYYNPSYTSDDVGDIFSNLISLERIWTNPEFSLATFEEIPMFRGCSALKATCGTRYDSAHVFGGYAHADDTTAPGYFSIKNAPHLFWGISEPTDNASNEDRVLYISGSQTTNAPNEDELPLYITDSTQIINLPWMKTPDTITKVVFEGSKIRSNNLLGWFKGMTNLTTVENLSDDYIEYSTINTISEMFCGCTNLQSISGDIQFRNVTDASMCFKGCENITNTDFMSWLESLQNAQSMYEGCSKLQRINEDTFPTYYAFVSVLENASSLFEGVGTKTESGFDASSLTNFKSDLVENMSSMFKQAKVVNLNVENWSLASLKDMSFMFYGTQGVDSVALGINSSTLGHVENMKSAFENFPGTFIDLTAFQNTDLTNNVSLDRAFWNCPNLTKIMIREAIWSVERVAQSDYVFDALNLVGKSNDGHLCKWDASRYSSLYAQNPKSPGYQGLFTDVNAPEYDSSYKIENGVLHLSPDVKTGYTLCSEIVTGFDNFGLVPWKDAILTGVVVDLGEYGQKLAPLSMNYWLESQIELTSIPESSFENIDSSNIKSMNHTFDSCRNLEEIHLESFTNENVEDMYSTFANCGKLHSIYAKTGKWDESSASGTYTFENCNVLWGRNIDGTHFTLYDPYEIEANYARIDQSDLTKGYFTDPESTPVSVPSYKIDGTNGILYLSPVNKEGYTLDPRISYGYRYSGEAPWSSITLKKIVIEKGPNEEKLVLRKMDYLFNSQSQLKSIEGLTNVDSSLLTSMNSTFASCSSLAEIDLSSFDGSKIESMNSTFNGCTSLSTIFADSDSWGDGKTGDNTFTDCHELIGRSSDGSHYTAYSDARTGGVYARVDLDDDHPGFFTEHSSPTAYYMIDETNGVLHLSGTEKSGYTEDYKILYGGYSASDLPPWCSYDLTSVVVDDQIKPYNMSYWFYNMQSLTSVDLTKIDSSILAKMNFTFRYCTGLTKIDLTSFDNSNLHEMNGTFYSCYNLETIYADEDKWMPNECSESTETFSGSTSLVGRSSNGKHTCAYRGDRTTGLFARIDVDEDHQGYFTDQHAPTAYYKVENGVLHISGIEQEGYTEEYRIIFGFTDIKWIQTVGITSVVVDDEIAPSRIDYLFKDFDDLVTVDFTKVSTSRLESMNSTFQSCDCLASIYVDPSDWSGEISGNTTFYGCHQLIGRSGDGEYVTKYDGLHYGASYACVPAEGQPGYFADPDAPTAYYKVEDEVLHISGTERTGYTEDVRILYGFSSDAPWRPNTIKTAIVDDEIKPFYMDRWFQYQTSLTSLDLSKIDSSHLISMSSTFYYCNSLTEIDLRSFVNTNITDMSMTFSGCSKLVSIYADPEKWEGGITGSYNTFSNDNSLIGISEDGSHSTKYSTAYQSSEYARVDSAESPGYFSYYGHPTAYWKVDAGTLHISGTEREGYTEDKKLLYVDSGSAPWQDYLSDITSVVIDDTIKPHHMNYWFEYATNLESLDFTNINTDYLETMRNTFLACGSITEIDLSMFNGQNITLMINTFADCNKLETIYADPTKWGDGKIGENIFTSDNMLIGRSRINGVNHMTKYDSSMRSGDVARVDGGASKPGLFTDPNAPAGYYMVDSENKLHISGLNKSGYEKDFRIIYGGYTDDNLPPWSSSNISSVVIDDSIKPNSMDYWFYHCSSLSSVDLTNIDTSELTTMNNTFNTCESLEQLDLTSFDNTTINSMVNTFADCQNLETIYADPTKWSESHSSSSGTFAGDVRLVGRSKDGTHATSYSQNRTDASYAQIDLSAEVPGYFTDITAPPALTAYYKVADGTLHISSTEQEGYTEDRRIIYGGYSATVKPPWCSESGITSAVVDNPIKIFSMNSWFYNLANLESVDLQNIDSECLTSMNYTFYGCAKLTEIDLSSFTVNNVHELERTFYGCAELTSIYVDSDKWDTSEATGVEVFRFAQKLAGRCTNGIHYTKQDESQIGVDYARVDLDDDHRGYFTDIKAPMGYWKVENNQTLHLSSTKQDGYQGDYRIIYGDYDSSTVRTPWYNELHSETLTNVIVDDEIKPSNMNCWLDTGDYITSVDFSKINSENLTSMNRTFALCTRLKTLDLSMLDGSKITFMNETFAHCYSLETIYVDSENWADSKSESTNTFANSTKLVGKSGDGHETPYSDSHVNADYAQVDQSDAHPGYFTARPNIDAYWKIADNKFYLSPEGGLGYIYEPRIITGFEQKIDVPWQVSVEQSFLEAVIQKGADGSKLAPTKMDFWFCTKESLTTIDTLENLDTSNLTSMRSTFDGCRSLTDIYLLNFVGDQITNLDYTFNNCTSLKSIYVSEGSWDTSAATTSIETFRFDNNLVGRTIDASHWTTLEKTGGATDGSYAHVDSVSSPGYFSPNGAPLPTSEELKNGADSKTLNLYPAESSEENEAYWSIIGDTLHISPISFTGYRLDSKIVSGFSSKEEVPWLQPTADSFTKVVIEEGPNGEKLAPVSMAYWFSDANSISSIDLANLDTKQIESLDSTFKNLGELVQLDLSCFDNSSLENIDNTFANCSNLIRIFADDELWQDKAYTAANNTFIGCDKLKGINLTGKHITDISSGHSGELARVDESDSLKGLFTDPDASIPSSMEIPRPADIKAGYWKVANGTLYLSPTDDKGYAKDETIITGFGRANIPWADKDFTQVKILKGADGSKLAPEKLDNWFYGRSEITSIDMSNLDTSKAKSAAYMFCDCSSLKELNVSKFDTKNIKNMSAMFAGCSSLEELNLESFDTENVKNMNGMFAGSSSLEKILVKDSFVVGSDTTGNNMFKDCTSIQGGEGTVYSPIHIDKAYAKIDQGEKSNSAGYFTDADASSTNSDKSKGEGQEPGLSPADDTKKQNPAEDKNVEPKEEEKQPSPQESEEASSGIIDSLLEEISSIIKW